MSTSTFCASGENVILKIGRATKDSDAIATSKVPHTSKEGDMNVTTEVYQTSKEGDVIAMSRVPQTSEEGDVVSNSSGVKSTEAADALLTLETADISQLEPQIGMVFHSEEQAFKLYNSYAKRKGFSVRKGHLSRRKDGSVRDRHYLCSNEGTRKEHRTHITKKPRALERTNCLARIEFKVNRDNVWVVNKFFDDHNHLLASPNKVHMLRSHRKKLPVQRAFITEMDYIGVKPAQGYDSQAEVACVTEDTGFLMKQNQSYNLLHANRVRDLEKGDAQFLLDFLKAKQSEDPSFFYAVQVDENDRLTNFFWTDARSIFDYTCFGDAVLLDTTYRASRYDIPLAPFIGINHHKQIVIFGAALLLDETTESFVWLFKTFMDAMSGRQPRTILTDLSASISKAISMTLPNTYHQLCLWHIIHNAPEIVPHVFGHDSNFQKEFENCIYESCSEDDFQRIWENLVAKYDLNATPWFKDLYAVQDKWSLVYCKSSFCATMTTKQWCEDMKNHFKMLFYRKLPPSKFVVQYHQSLNHLREKELSEDFESMQAKRVLLAEVPMLIEASESYTRTMYREFEDEYKSQLACLCEHLGVDGRIYTFRVSVPQKRSYGIVEYDPSDVSVTCSCKKFETMGILCMHALKVLNYNNILHLPSRYILKRWTKYAKDGAGSDRLQPVFDSNGTELLTLRYTQVCRKAINVAVKSALSKDALEFVELELDRFMAQMDYALHNYPPNKQSDDMNLVHNVQENTIEATNISW